MLIQDHWCRDAGRPLSLHEVLEQAKTFIAAGYETTAAAVAFTVYLLTQNRKAETALLCEIDRLGRDVSPAYSNLEDWKYAKVRTAKDG